MRRRPGSLAVALLSQLASSSCASALYVTYHSDPEGATLYANQDQHLFGQTPITLKYNVPDAFQHGQCSPLQPTYVRWASGVQAMNPGLNVCPQNGLKQQFTFMRPAGVAGADVDAQAAFRQQEIAAQQKAQHDAAALAALSALSSTASATTAPANALGLPAGKIMIFGGTGHKTYLGCLSCSKFDGESVFNSFGTHGSAYSSESIFNKFGEFGSKYSTTSACNQFATDPPVIVDGSGNYYGRLTLNDYRAERANPQLRAWLTGVCQ